jgi:hypothetical protein
MRTRAIGRGPSRNGGWLWRRHVSETLGFRPACSCDAGDAIPCTVLDPFGAGTTGVVAKQHGRSYVGIELNPTYLEMGRERIANTPSPVADTRIEAA